MGMLGALGFSLLLASLTQIPPTQAKACTIISISSPSASSLLVKWNNYNGATNYLLDLRVKDRKDIAPVLVTLKRGETMKVVNGLRPATTYNVTLKVFEFYVSTCTYSQEATTVPDTSQISDWEAISSRAIRLKWLPVEGAARYFLVVESKATGEIYNMSLTNLSVEIYNLQSSTAYKCRIYSSNVAGLGASSKVKTVITLVQPPDGIIVTTTGKDTARVEWEAVDKVLMYRVTITKMDTPDNKTFVIDSYTTFLDIFNILPCSTYRITVASINDFLLPGDPNVVIYTTNTASTVESLSANYECSSSSVTVEWKTDFPADLYRVTADRSDGTALYCTSEATSCQITGVKCGESYRVQITSFSNNCESTSDITANFETAPCAPTGLTLYRECSSNLIAFSWTPIQHASHYVAKAVDSTGKVQDCLTGTNGCLFVDTKCGRGYKFTVQAVGGTEGCTSQTSASASIKTAPCPATNMKTTAECNSDVLISTWDMAAGALSYRVDVQGNAAPRSRYSCTSFTNSCAMPGVHCGESLSVNITSLDNECSSETILGPVAETVPCVPQNVSAVMDCSLNSIRMTWEFSHGASFYMASAAHADGTLHTCVTMDTWCTIPGLHCGQTYSTFVKASNFRCNSSESVHISVETAPCPPDRIEASLDCTANRALVSWQSHLIGASYTATMEDQEGGFLSCMSPDNNCTIPGLKCGQEYTVTVMPYDSICPGVPSDTIHMHSVPCGPKNMQTSVRCGTGVLNVSWNASLQADSYTSTLSSENGEETYCNSTDTRCSFSGLECGLSYTVAVKSVTGACLSMPSRQLVREAPCVPTNVTAERSCGNSSVKVTWEGSRGARYYNAIAVGDSGHTTRCMSNGTACIIADLHCGQVYTVGVTAMDDNCSSLQSETVTLHTVPCPPPIPSVTIDCVTNMASVSWDASPNAVSYQGRAVGTDGHSLSCDSGSPGCQMTGLHCGQQYTFTVSATDGNCRSPESMEFTQASAPCAVQSVGTRLYCDSNVLTVSWNASGAALNYSALARASDGTAHSCSSTGSSCDISSLGCGQNYSVTVTASNGNCSGPASAAHTIQTVPCVPQDLTGRVECGSNRLTASWSASPGVSSYTSTVSGPGGYSASCSTSNLTCSFGRVLCAQRYAINVLAHDHRCNSTASPAVSVVTGPCEPEHVTTALRCRSNALNVSWHPSPGASEYTVLAQQEDGRLFSCRTVDIFCPLSQLECGEVYNVTVLAGDGTCNSSSNPQDVIETAPCPPVIEGHAVDCATNTASLSWESKGDIVEFVINGTSALGLKTSCSTANTSCELLDLQCGQTYTLYGTARGEECDSGPGPRSSITTAPCATALVGSLYDCKTNIAQVSWDDSLGRESFYAWLKGDGHAESCSTTETMCIFTSLQCGQHYNVTVSALANHCNSSQSAGSGIQTAPCPPQNVSASLMCANHTAVVTWAPTAGAVAYNVTALGRNGDTKSCRTPSTSCDLPLMHCGQDYAINVTPYSETCDGFPSETIIYTAGPCPPNDLEVTLECDGNIGSVSWESVIGAELYVATARSDDGHEHTCNSTHTNCSFADLHCGETYSVTVVTFMRGCYSEPSPGKTLKAAICPPLNLAGLLYCETGILIVSWDSSPGDGVTYFLVSEKEGGASATYATADTSYFVTGLQCGEHHTFRVITQDSTCNSSLSLPWEQDTAPCPPSNLMTTVDCGTSRATVSWVPGVGGVTHTVLAVGAHGHKASCSSNGTSCSARLDCGRPYTATVFSSNDLCNSTMDTTIQFDSAPCLPGNVTAELNCSRNEFAVQWQDSMGSETYTALAIGSDGHRATCNTSSTSCTIEGLHCGQIYSIAVVTSSVQCGLIEGSDYMIQSAPCTPANPAVNVDCTTNSATVFWGGGPTQQINIVIAVAWLGQLTSCNTTNSNCTFTSLSCGETYSFTVVGVTDQCRTATVATMEHRTAPCVPTHVLATLDCLTGIAMVTWDSAPGATSYSVQAVSSLGHNTSCSAMDTQCSLDSLMCGQVYNITVAAVHDDCRGPASETVVLITDPCPHTNLEASRDCASNAVAVSWTPGLGALLYNASVEALAAGHRLSCSTDGSACNVSSLQCGERYRVSVKGQDLSCVSDSGFWVPIDAAPCPPTEVSVQTMCAADMASVTWEPAKGAVRYVAAAEDSAGNVVTCNTSATACDITGLSCGRSYNVSVTALDEECVSGRSETHPVKTAPCVPRDMETNLVCQTGRLGVAWQQSEGALLYHAVVQNSSGGTTADVMVNTTDFYVNLPCGDTYNITVYASDEVCSSSPGVVKSVTAAPCPPASIVTDVDCATSITNVSWVSSAHGVTYTAEAVEAGGHHSVCNTTDTYCPLTDLRCGTVYNVTVSGCLEGCQGAQTSEYTFITAPCIPFLTEVEIDCLSDSAWVVWEESAGAELYTASARDDQDRVFQCNTSESTCAVPALPCGRQYTFTMAASDPLCTSMPSNAIVSESAPCPPQDVVTRMGCENRTATISWAESRLALMYTATLERTDGDTACCTTAGTSCDIADLPCGEMYVLTVSAEGRTCNSSQSVGSIIRTVPCTPQNLTACVNCSTNAAKATWSSSRGGQLYIVEASGDDGHSTTCNSFENSCDLDVLHCGQSYTITVVAEDSTCTSSKSQSAQFKTVPCIPQNVSAEVDCETNSMTISWEESDGADSYTATLQDGDGRFTNCQALGANSCNVSGLHCGKTYHMTVAASDGYCTSPESSTTDAESVPCSASHIRASMDCVSQTAFVSWYFSTGAWSYTATLESESGHAVAHSTNLTNSIMGGLACGDHYSVSVLAQGQTCNRTAQMPGSLLTEPCVPLNLGIRYRLSIGQLTWDMSKGAAYYSAEALTDWGLRAACNTTDTTCALYDMACSQIYNITVTAHNRACADIATSDPMTLVTEPCPPRNVEADLDCKTGRASVSWEISDCAVAYHALLLGRDGHSTSCYTTSTSCSVDALHCGTAYYIQVRAVGMEFNSTDSNDIVLTTAPCVPDTVEMAVDCENGSALVSWKHSDGAQSYEVFAAGMYGQVASCSTEKNFCQVTDLSCGEMYNLSLNSVNEQCSVLSDTGLTFQTRPCAPLHVAVDLQCGTNAAMLSWETSDGVEFYVVNATKSNGEHTGSLNSTGSTGVFSSLDCGETYFFTVTACSSQCESPLSDTVEVTTGPCRPGAVSAKGSCNNSTAGPTMVLLGWKESRGVLVYIVTAMGDLGYIEDFDTTDTSLEVWLPCGQTFSFSVVAQGEQCDSAPSGQAEFRTAPCVPQYLHSYVFCEDSIGSVSWMPSDGAESYTAVAVGQDSHTHMCITNGTTCTWTELHCGDVYIVHVMANDGLCSSLPSNGTAIYMAPCVPQNLVSSLDCDMKVGTLTWEVSENAGLYVVIAEASNGHRMEVTTNINRTAISEFACGQVYFLSVRAVGAVCMSAPSAASSLQTEPCAPTAVTATLDCVTNMLLVEWAGTVPAEYYTATVQAQDGQSAICMSSSTQCGIASLRCAQNYTVFVTASNAKCTSAQSNSTSLRSAPCIPENVAVLMDCMDNTALVSWNHSQGALSYRVFAESSRGNASCESSMPHCRLASLACGTAYVVWVVALDSSCTTIPSERVHFESVPCTPEISNVHLDCFMNSILMEWGYAEGALFYTGVAETGGDMATCDTNHTNCEIMDLECGMVYNVTIVASNGNCNSSQSAAWEVASVPCAPENVMYQLDCASHSANVTWEVGNGAEFYEVYAIGWGGHIAECSTAELACTVPDLMCGYNYNISVVAVAQQCNVSESDVTKMQALPCVPQLVEASVDCESAVVSVSWEESYGATDYAVIAQGNGGYASSCNTSGTVCQFADLLCGTFYSVTVSAGDDVCSSGASAAVHVDTVPCEPQNVSAAVDCSSDEGLVTWEPGEGVASYHVLAAGVDGHLTQCNSSSDRCMLLGLHCGQRYNLTVTADDGQCDTSRAYLSLQSVPCEPHHVQAAAQCPSSSASVTWGVASGALSYLAVGKAQDGHTDSCNSSALHCHLESLRCGQLYSVSVRSLDESCSSADSQPSQVRTAPCPPTNLEASMSCDAGILLVAWDANDDADSYRVEALSSGNVLLSCQTPDTFCSIPGALCGHNYTVHAVSIRDGCESLPSAAVSLSSAPCVSKKVSGNLDCVTNSAWVSWEEAMGAHVYTAIAEGVGGYNSSCTTTETTCNVPDLRCGVLYTFHLIAANGDCQSPPSASFEIETAPCALTAIDAVAECHSSSIRVEWELEGGSQLYIATAEGSDRSVLSCNSSVASCSLEGARCGVHYTVIVAASSDKCSSLRSPPHKISTAPCAPQNVSFQADCESPGLVASWAPSLVADSYLLTVQGGDGDVHACNTTASNCTLTGLRCGQPYSFTVTASSQTCVSPHSAELTFSTVPCEPDNLRVELQCASSSAVLSWNTSQGLAEYIACAQGSAGDLLYCSSTNSSCVIDGLECGAEYSFSVLASNGVCNSSFGAPLLQGAVPCPPESVKARMLPVSDVDKVLRVSWNIVVCTATVVEYMSEVTGSILGDSQALFDMASYWTERTYFEFPLPCSSTYNVTVKSRNPAGIGKPSELISGLSVPCPPLNINYVGNSTRAFLSWDASIFATEYAVYEPSSTGRIQICDTPLPYCDLIDIFSDELEITARNSGGESSPTIFQLGSTSTRRKRDLKDAEIHAKLNENLQTPILTVSEVKRESVLVEWNAVRDAVYYTLLVTDSAGKPTYHSQSEVERVFQETYNVTGLEPNTTYCVSVSAKNDTASSPYSKPIYVHTAV